MDIIFDIETAPLAAGMYTATDEKTGEVKDIGALSPITGKIIGIGWSVGEKITSLVSEDEKLLLASFWNMVRSQTEPFRLVGFNNKRFDIHFLLVRSLHHNVQTVPLSNRTVIDIRDHLTFFQSYMKKGTLHDYALLIGCAGKHDELTGEDIPRLWAEGKKTAIEQYLHQDIVVTKQLFEKCVQLKIIL